MKKVKVKKEQIPKKPTKEFKTISGREWLDIVNSFGLDGLQELKVNYYKLSDGKLAVILRNNWQTFISELVDTEDKIDKEEERLRQIHKMQGTTDAAHTNAFLDLGKLLTR